MKNLCTKAALFIASLCAGNFLIRHFGNLYIDAITGYLRGNRRRVVSIIKLEWLMLHLDLIIYLHLFSFFTPPHVIWSFSGGRKSKSTTNYIKNLRFQCFCVYLISMFFAHLLYFLYIFENVEVPWMLYDISGIFNGIWLHLSAFSVFFVGINLVQDCLFARFEIFRKFVDEEIFRRFRALRLFCRVPQFQVLITLAVSFVFCLSHWYFCDKIFIRSMTLQLSEDSVNQTLRVVVLTDLHAGASVYRQQIENVVDATNSLQNVDAIFIIGDAIDAPQFLIEDRMRPLKFLRSRLGTFFVTGNHEYYYGNVEAWIKNFQAYGISTIRNRAISLNGLCVVGLDDMSSDTSGIIGHSMNVSAISKCPPNQPIVVLAHNPAATDQILTFARNTRRHVSAIFSGHTHAAQYYVMAPYIYWFLPYFYGVYRVSSSSISTDNNANMSTEPTTLLVSAGTLYQGGAMKMPFMSQIWLLDLMYSS